MQANAHFIHVLSSCLFVGSILICSATQGQSLSTVVNARFENQTDGTFVGWGFNSNAGAKLDIETSSPFEGKQSAVINGAEIEKEAEGFSNLVQSLDATAFRNKRIRYQAAVKTSDVSKQSRAQLWCRVDCKDSNSGETKIGGFDNMDDRPIRSTEWTRTEIVLDVDNDATSIVFGMFLIGKGKAYLDDVSVEETSKDTKVTGKNLKKQSSGYQLPPEVRKAFEVAESAPQQSFWSPWLALPLLAIVTFAIGLSPRWQVLNQTNASPSEKAGYDVSLLRRVCFRFTFAYWFLYCVPSLLAYIPYLGGRMVMTYESTNAIFVRWAAKNMLGIQNELVPPNGSGDTTYNYVSALLSLSAACLVTVIWTLVDRRKTNYFVARDVLWICMRYHIGLVLIGYGLAKLSLEFSQFPPPIPAQLNKTWGESSPMNVLWTFMGYSRAYTFFSGFGEIVAGGLLVWRRTATLGALIAAGVMANVVMLNMSYDVPVKLMSSHLLVLACLVAIPDSARLLSAFVLNRTTQPADLIGPWTHSAAWWTKLALKLLVILWCMGIPFVTQSFSLASEIKNMKEPAEDDFRLQHRLTKRGFRWINEVPYNR